VGLKNRMSRTPKQEQLIDRLDAALIGFYHPAVWFPEEGQYVCEECGATEDDLGDALWEAGCPRTKTS
jgi:hypothetical protein